ncbi:MAG: hypothetical protein K0M46_04175 [Thiobacillus sp.]|nr:hypothetical protein [Thiobacillus sp.]
MNYQAIYSPPVDTIGFDSMRWGWLGIGYRIRVQHTGFATRLRFTHSGDRAWLDLSFRMLHVGISRAAPKALPGMLRSALQTTQTVWQERQQIALAVERPRFSGW